MNRLSKPEEYSSGITDPARLLGHMILKSFGWLRRTGDIDDILPYPHDDITLPILGAALFEWGWVHSTDLHVHATDALTLGDIGYVTDSNFVVVDNIHHCLQGKSEPHVVVVDNVEHRLQGESQPLFWNGGSGSTGATSLKHIPVEEIISSREHVYHRRRQVYFPVCRSPNLSPTLGFVLSLSPQA